MGEGKSGQNMWAGIGIQSAKEVVATNFQWLQITEAGGFMKIPKSIGSNRRVGTRFKPAGYQGGYDVPFNFSMEANPGNIGAILRAGLGEETPSLVSAEYHHSFELSEDLPYVTVIFYAAGIADNSGTEKCIQVQDAKLKLGFSGGADGDDTILMINVEGTGLDLSAIAVPTTDFPDDTPFFYKSVDGVGKVSLASVADTPVFSQFNEFTTFSLDVASSYAPDNRIDDTAKPYAMRIGSSELTGEVTAIYNDDSIDEIMACQNGTPKALKVEFTTENLFETTKKKRLIFTFSQIKYNSPSPSYDADLITVGLPFTVDVWKGVTVELIDDVDHEYDAAFTEITA